MKVSNQALFQFPEESFHIRATETHITNQQKSLVRLDGRYVPDYISDAEEKSLLGHIDSAEWITELKRRVQHYGYRYDYRDRKISQDMRIGDLPEWVMPLAKRLGADFFGGKRPDQMIINEYEPGQGIAPHVDCEPCFGKTVVSISLGSTCVMNLMRRAAATDDVRRAADAESDKITLFLEPRSAVILAGDSRYLWTHGIAPRKTDTIGGCKYPRKRRVSLTFRSVIL
ncbi:MAG: alpha-ketoglutarate-dependent dioxygenase AlkB [Gammaproteobacteria bacterium]|nr:alpha-ketoglutarate-dependent dioxygenase AlkB [Gammaproteobacteria bacterium]